MKTYIAYFLFITLLSQSCIVYQNTSVSINQTLDQGSVKVVTTLNDEIELRNIHLIDSVYYGEYRGNQIPLDTAQILELYLQDIEKSKKLNKKGAKIIGITIIGTQTLMLVWALILILFTNPF